jgi:hypothetical protein
MPYQQNKIQNFQQMKFSKKSQHKSSRRLKNERSLLKTKHASQKIYISLYKKKPFIENRKP